MDNEITCFAYPFGAFSGLTPYVVIEAGYLMAFNVSGGPQPLDTSIDRWHILRINVNGNGDPRRLHCFTRILSRAAQSFTGGGRTT